MRLCPHGFHHPDPFNPASPHSCDGCWCEGASDRRDYGWPHDTAPDEPPDEVIARVAEKLRRMDERLNRRSGAAFEARANYLRDRVRNQTD
jgi:hypothetical protein